MQDKGRDARLIIYPGIGRGFDFRPENVRTFADDLASKDAVQRAAKFMRKHLEKSAVSEDTGSPLTGEVINNGGALQEAYEIDRLP